MFGPWSCNCCGLVFRAFQAFLICCPECGSAEVEEATIPQLLAVIAEED